MLSRSFFPNVGQGPFPKLLETAMYIKDRTIDFEYIIDYGFPQGIMARYLCVGRAFSSNFVKRPLAKIGKK